MQSPAAIAAYADADGRHAERARFAAILHDPRLAARPAEIVLAIDLALKAPEATGADCVAWVIEHARPKAAAGPRDAYQAQVDAKTRRAALTVIEGGT